jgi:uncharacterized membrane protein
MLESGTLALLVHILGFTFWVGSLLTVSLLLSAAGEDAATRAKVGALARRVAVVADIAAAVAIVGGLSLLFTRSWDLRQPWMHVKLTLAVGLVAVHGIVRVRAKRLAGGGAPPGLGAAIAIVVFAVGIITVVVLKVPAR